MAAKNETLKEKKRNMSKFLFPEGHKINMGRKASEETKRKMSETHKKIGTGKWNKNRKRPQWEKQKNRGNNIR